MKPGKKGPPAYRVKVWDLPTRLFHWALVALVILSFVTGKLGGTAMGRHEWSGVAILVLVLFRLVWGFAGGELSRFRSFVRGPSTVCRYGATLLKRESRRHLGHNPLGGWSVVLLLTALLVQAGTGLFANDDILTEGPLFRLVSKSVSDQLTGIHHLSQSILIGLIAIHVAAILFYLTVKKENLITPMVTGVKVWPQAARPALGKVWLAGVIVILLALAAYSLLL
ncbi:MAG: cytochrome b/b6 domain-containing protein [Desulfobacterales bacterium]